MLVSYKPVWTAGSSPNLARAALCMDKTYTLDYACCHGSCWGKGCEFWVNAGDKTLTNGVSIQFVCASKGVTTGQGCTGNGTTVFGHWGEKIPSPTTCIVRDYGMPTPTINAASCPRTIFSLLHGGGFEFACCKQKHWNSVMWVLADGYRSGNDWIIPNSWTVNAICRLRANASWNRDVDDCTYDTPIFGSEKGTFNSIYKKCEIKVFQPCMPPDCHTPSGRSG